MCSFTQLGIGKSKNTINTIVEVFLAVREYSRLKSQSGRHPTQWSTDSHMEGVGSLSCSPVGAARNSISPSCYSSPTPPRDVSSAGSEQLSSPMTCYEADSNGSNSLVISNGSGTNNIHTSSQTEVEQMEATRRNKNRLTKAEPSNGMG